MNEMDDYYRLFGLNPGASEEEIKEAYKDLIKVWHPDRISNNPRLKEKANAKLREINLAYEVLKAYIAGKSESFRATGERGTRADSQPPPREHPPKSEKEQGASTNEKGEGGFQTPPEQPPAQRLHDEDYGRISADRRFKPFFSWPNISFFICYGFGLAKSIAKYGDLTRNSFGESLGISILPIIFFVIYNSIKGEAKTIRILSIIANLLFLFLFLSSTLLEITGIVSTTQSEHDTSTAFVSPSSPPTGESSSTGPSPEKEKRPDWATDDWLRSLRFDKPIPGEPPRTSERRNVPERPVSQGESSKRSPFLVDLDVPKDMIWKRIAQDNEGSTFSYDTKYSFRVEGRVVLYTRTVYGPKANTRTKGQLGNGYEKLKFSLELNDINCAVRMACRIKVLHYSEEGLLLGYSETPSEWTFIPPNTFGEMLFQEVCR